MSRIKLRTAMIAIVGIALALTWLPWERPKTFVSANKIQATTTFGVSSTNNSVVPAIGLGEQPVLPNGQR